MVGTFLVLGVWIIVIQHTYAPSHKRKSSKSLNSMVYGSCKPFGNLNHNATCSHRQTLLRFAKFVSSKRISFIVYKSLLQKTSYRYSLAFSTYPTSTTEMEEMNFASGEKTLTFTKKIVFLRRSYFAPSFKR